MTDTIATAETGPIWNEWSAEDIRTEFATLSTTIEDIHHHQMCDEQIRPWSEDAEGQLEELRRIAEQIVIAGAHALAAIPHIRAAADYRRWLTKATDEQLRDCYRHLPGTSWNGRDPLEEQRRIDIENEWTSRGHDLDAIDPDDPDPDEP